MVESVLLGAVLLLNNLKVIPWDIWRDLWHYWPVLLILAGAVFLIDRDSKRPVRLLGMLIAILAVGAISTGVLYINDNKGLYFDSVGNRLAAANEFSLATNTDSVPRAVLNLRLRRGELTLHADTGGHLLSATGSYDWRSDEPVLSEHRPGNRATVDFTAGRTAIIDGIRAGSDTPVYKLQSGRPETDCDLSYQQNSGMVTLG